MVVNGSRRNGREQVRGASPAAATRMTGRARQVGEVFSEDGVIYIIRDPEKIADGVPFSEQELRAAQSYVPSGCRETRRSR